MKIQDDTDAERPDLSLSRSTSLGRSTTERRVDVDVVQNWMPQRSSDQDRIWNILDKTASSIAANHIDMQNVTANLDTIHLELAGSNKKHAGFAKSVQLCLNNTGWNVGQQVTQGHILGARLLADRENKGFKLIEVMKYRKLPRHTIDGVLVEGTEWDCIPVMEKDDVVYVYFLEAKKTSNSQDMLTMPQRLGRAMSWMRFSGDATNLPVKKQDRSRFIVWGQYTNSIVCGVIGADVLPLSVVEMARAHNFMTISLNSEAWVIVDPAFPHDDGDGNHDP